jgi:hypothetical protein
MAQASFVDRLMHTSGVKVIQRLGENGLLPKLRRHRLLDAIPSTTIAEAVGNPIIRLDGSYTYFDGSLPWPDMAALLSLLVVHAPRTIFEIGTFNGHTTRLMAINLPEAEIHTIDLPQDFSKSGSNSQQGGLQKDDWHLISTRNVGSEYLRDPSIKSVTQHFGDTANYAFPAAEFFFIDGSHTYDYARSDTEKALATGTAKVLVWHDCDRYHPGVTQWLGEMVQAGYPVRRIEGTYLAFLELPSPS